jgi:hypothetical protein
MANTDSDQPRAAIPGPAAAAFMAGAKPACYPLDDMAIEFHPQLARLMIG